MLGQDSYGVQRRPLDVEDYIDIARRHKGWIFGPAFLALVLAVVTAFLWPDTYQSTATIKVNPQQIPTNFVQANVNQQMQDRITSLAQTIVSRNVLQGLIQTHGLYKKELERRPIDDVVEEMRKDIQIGAVTSLTGGASKAAAPQRNQAISAFQVSFDYTDRYKAQKVVSDLAGKFIVQNFQDRSNDSRMTSQLLNDAWLAAKRELDKADAALAEFRVRNQGRLPDEMQSNLTQMGAVQTRLSSLSEALSRVNQERVMMEGLLRIYKDELATAKAPKPQRTASIQRKSEKLNDIDREIKKLEDTLNVLRERYKDSHPDVQRASSMLANAKKRRETVQKEETSENADAAPEAPVVTDQALKEIRELEQKYRQTENQIAAKNLESQDIQKEIDRLNASMRSFETRLQGVPFSEKEYTELVRSRDLAKANFLDLDNKLTKSKLAQDMEDRKQGESLEILDQASLPMTPTKPKRFLIVGVGTVLGIMIGFALAGLREVKDTSLKNLKDVRAYTQMAVLGSIPLLENDLVIRRRRRMAWLGWALACLAGVAVMSGSIIYYYATHA